MKKLTLIIEKKQSNMKTLDHSYHQNFEYKHQNPYHDKLGEFSDFVFRDTEGEKLKGNWSKEFFKNDQAIKKTFWARLKSRLKK